MAFHFETRIAGEDMDAAVARVKETLQQEGFGVLTEIDVEATLKEKLDAEFRPYRILGACNPPLAHAALCEDRSIGMFLPCNVVVEEDPAGGFIVAFADPQAMFTMMDRPALQPIADEAAARLRRVCEALGS
jgi:uncharacterized protein (DUF302 family)